MNPSTQILSDLVIHSKYARYLDEQRRREIWPELTDRNMTMHLQKFPQLAHVIHWAYEFVRNKVVLPSMRSMQFAGRAIERANNRMFNCCFLPIDHPAAFSELIFLLLGGSGVGYSVLPEEVRKLPPLQNPGAPQRYIAHDSIEGWADCVKMLMKSYFYGKPFPVFDLSDIRPKGTRLVTAGGKAPGPEPLELALFLVNEILAKKCPGDRLTTLEAHDICCILSDAVVAGGIRRCIPQHYQVFTPSGAVQIKDLKVGDEVLTGFGRTDKVVAVECTGRKPLVEIRTNLGSFFSTAEHRWAVLDSLEGSVAWKAASALTVTDRLVFDRQGYDGQPTSLPAFEDQELKSKKVVVPALTPEISWFFGYLLGNGYVQQTHHSDTGFRDFQVKISMPTEFPLVEERVRDGFRQFGFEPARYIRKNGKACEWYVSSVNLTRYLSQFKAANSDLKVPTFLWSAPREIRAAFLAGLFDADGSIKNGDGKLPRPTLVSTKHGEFARQVQGLYASLGLPVRVAMKHHHGGKSDEFVVKTVSNRFTDRCVEAIDLYSSKLQYHDYQKREGLSDKENYSFSLPKELYQKRPHGTEDYARHFALWNSNTRLSLELYEREFGERSYIPVSVEGVFSSGDDVTYDIEVEHDHCFIVEGLLTHNSAMISFFDLEDEAMRTCKQGAWWEKHPWRARSNNSAMVYRPSITRGQFDLLWKATEESRCGEPGIYWSNDPLRIQKSNPCAEAGLQPYQMCNLTSINASAIRTQEQLNEAAAAASFIGTLQASYTNFHYLRPIWKKTTDEDALLGVSITGVANRDFLDLDLEQAACEVLSVNEHYAPFIGVNLAARTTLMKPEGTSSLLLGTSSGAHSWYSKWYLRRLRLGKDEAIHSHLLEACPQLMEDDVEKPQLQSVLTIPIAAPEGAIVREDESPIDLLERVKYLQQRWVLPGHRYGINPHSVSCTVEVGDGEWQEVGEWMWQNRENYACISAFPKDGGTYVQAPFEACSKETYEQLSQYVQGIDLTQVFESEDGTTISETVACAGGACEIR